MRESPLKTLACRNCGSGALTMQEINSIRSTYEQTSSGNWRQLEWDDPLSTIEFIETRYLCRACGCSWKSKKQAKGRFCMDTDEPIIEHSRVEFDMPVQLTCDFCEATTNQFGEWRVEGDSTVDVVICPECYRKYAPIELAWQAWEDESQRVAHEIRKRHSDKADKAAAKEIAAWEKKNPMPPEIDWVQLKAQKRS